ncbi:GAF domain-containing protein [Acuticoccus sp. I52.16.1]|uniref:GAF domain-containing protein n=1 Tax=Acuticoccus sp. I52.16.1 TaxID=2928472 RepID=UPI001FD17E29|nr:GAF domain-containing protein [Acuticoccus sp. I52.16.1]UOM33244.1 GAF domain-containing protein [Acuticoccus sp. I52.16.1]
MNLTMREAKAASGSAPVMKRPFIRVTEVWVPSEDGPLTLKDGLYGPLDDFERVARETRFAKGEGLPGMAWETGVPIVLKDLVGSYFKRGAAAELAGLTCAVAVPVFQGDTLNAVLVMFCGDDAEHVGAIELWHAPPRDPEMALVDGYFGTADVFEWTARHVNFVKGSGLPGQTWERGFPVVFANLASPRFLRWEKAAKVGITRGFSLPIHSPQPGVYVLAFLSALATPIARRVEVWVAENGRLKLADGFCEQAGLLGAAPLDLAFGEGAIGMAATSGVPQVTADLSAEPAAIASAARFAQLDTLVALPVFGAGGLVAVAVWYL